jgi:glycosyltransferase involved in cell wall biosynthesis
VDVQCLPSLPYPAGLLANLDPRLPRRLERAGYHALLQDELAHPALFRANSGLRKRLRCPLLAVVHHLRCREPYQSRLLRPVFEGVERRYLQSVDALVLASRHAADCSRQLLSGLPEHVLAPPGADHAGPAAEPEIVSRRCGEPGPLKLLFVGHVTPRKGLLPALRSLTKVRDLPWELHVAGDLRSAPRYAKTARRRMEQWGLADRARLLGRVADEQLRRLYRECHLLFMPFAYEGYGIVLLEAMAAGLPVLARQGCGTAEIVRHGENGFLLAPGDLDGAAARLRELSGDRERLAAMGHAAREAFLRHPTWERSMARVERFLVSLAGQA